METILYIVCMVDVYGEEVHVLGVYTDYTKALTMEQARIARWENESKLPHKIQIIEYKSFLSTHIE